jgi:hypothetical protein
LAPLILPELSAKGEGAKDDGDIITFILGLPLALAGFFMIVTLSLS